MPDSIKKAPAAAGAMEPQALPPATVREPKKALF